MKILIIGGTGYVGRKLSLFLVKNNYQITIVSRNKYNSFNQIENLVHVYHDITQNGIKEKILNLNFDLIINLSTAKVEDKTEVHQNLNTLGIENILELLVEYNTPIIHFSSLAIHNKIKSDYDNGKMIAEKIISKKKVNGLILRLPAIITENYPNYYILKFITKFRFIINFLPNKIKNYKLNGPVHYLELFKIISIIIENKLYKTKLKKFDVQGPDIGNFADLLHEKNFNNKNLFENFISYKIKSIFNFI